MRRLRWFIPTLLTLVVVSLASQAKAGGIDAGGGDAYASEFVRAGYSLIETLSSGGLPEINLEQYIRALSVTKIETTDSLRLGSAEVDAINHPNETPPRIQLSRNRWDRLKENGFAKALLVFHEYLAIMAVDDANYRVSRLIDRARVCERSGAIVRELRRQMGGIDCHRILPEDLQKLTYLRVEFGSFEGDPRSPGCDRKISIS